MSQTSPQIPQSTPPARPCPPILVFLVTDGPDLSTLHIVTHGEDKTVSFSIMPGAFCPEPNDAPGRIVPAMDSAVPTHIKIDHAYFEQENDDGAVIFGKIVKASQYLGHISENPLWHSMHQLIEGDNVCLSYNFVRKEGGLVVIPAMVIGSRSRIQRLCQDKGKRRDPYQATPDLRYPPFYCRPADLSNPL